MATQWTYVTMPRTLIKISIHLPLMFVFGFETHFGHAECFELPEKGKRGLFSGFWRGSERVKVTFI